MLRNGSIESTATPNAPGELIDIFRFEKKTSVFCKRMASPRRNAQAVGIT
jgi:hypothetical protein